MGKKNFIIVLLIFLVPIIAYKIMSKTSDNVENKIVVNQPQIIKFSSQMCSECKKLEAVLDEVYPKYSEKIALVKIQVSSNDEYTKKLIEKYNVTLTPTLIILNSKGDKLSKIEGFVEKDKLEMIMKDLVNK